jgi:hypothetical protein
LLTNISRAVGSNGTYFDYQRQVEYRWQQALEFGAQRLGDTGRWNHRLPASEQSHRLGTAVSGRWAAPASILVKHEAPAVLTLTARKRPAGEFPKDRNRSGCDRR